VRTILMTAVLVCLMALPSSAAAQFWTQPGPAVNQTPSPILPSDGRSAVSNIQDGPVLARVAGVVHAAWTEWDGANFEVRVAKMVDGRWVAVGSGCSPINARSDLNAFDVGLGEYQGRPVVTWTEVDGNSMRQAHAARFDPTAGEWSEAWGPVTSFPRYPPTPVENPPTFYGHDSIYSSQPQVLVVAGRLHIGFIEGNLGGSVASLVRLSSDGTRFERLARPQNTYDPRDSTRYVTDGERLFLYHEGPVHKELYRRDGETWTQLGRPPEVDSDWSVAGVDVQGGLPSVMWREAFRDDSVVRISRRDFSGWSVVSTVALPDPVGLHLSGDSVFTSSGGSLHRRTGTGPWVSLGAPDRGDGEGSLAPQQADLEIFDGRAWMSWRQWNGQSWDGRVARSVDTATAPGGEGTSGPPPGCGSTPPPGDDDDGDDDGTDDKTGTAGTGSSSTGGTGGGTPVTGGAASVTTPVVALLPPRPASQVALLNRRVTITRKGRAVRLRIRCTSAVACRGVLVARGYSRGRGLELGRTRISLPAGRTATVTLPLNERARRMLRRGSLRYELTVRPTG
jgi:hypothetical protein